MFGSFSRYVTTGAIASSLALAAGCAWAQTKLTFQLNWVAGGANAGSPRPWIKASIRKRDWT